MLGGIASFTIVDGARVTARDLGSNFLLDTASLGGARAQAVAEHLKELNDAVDGSFIVEEPSALVASNPDCIRSFDIIIATQVLPVVSSHVVECIFAIKTMSRSIDGQLTT